LKVRLDTFLVDNGYFPTREKAKTAIMEGLVYVNGQISDKAGNMINPDHPIEVKGNTCPYVSRGGLKLAKAVEVFNLKFDDLVCLDIGASTGGFTDCMLQNGAIKVYAIDVGYGQLDYKLRNDSRVINMEKCNFRYIEPNEIDDECDFACTDVSFISLKHIFPPAFSLLKDGAQFVALIKPQFEAGREQVGKNGIIKDPLVHSEVINKVFNYANESGFSIKALDYSPIKGAKGNIEFLVLLQKNTENNTAIINNADIYINAVVNSAHSKED